MDNSTSNATSYLEEETACFLSSIPSIVLFIILLISIVSNTFLVIVILTGQSTTKKPFTFVDKLTVQLAFLDIVLVLTSIPEMLISESYGSFKFGPVGCKFVHPLSTYAVTAEVMTLLLIAYERLKVTQSKTPLIHTCKRHCHIYMALVHAFSIAIVIPYILVLNYQKQIDSPGYMCGETWLIHQRRLYTLTLFLVQYGIPAPLMVAFYYVAFRRIWKANKRLIKLIQSPEPESGRRVTSKLTSSSSTASEDFVYKPNRIGTFTNSTKRLLQRAVKYRSSNETSLVDPFTMKIEDSSSPTKP